MRQYDREFNEPARAVIKTTARIRAEWLIFFFQAEDGIRDYKVTGVQTCALPISPGQRATGSERAQAHCRTGKSHGAAARRTRTAHARAGAARGSGDDGCAHRSAQ